jgi:isopentenyl phosphate kinase
MGWFGRKVRVKSYRSERQLKRNAKSQARRGYDVTGGVNIKGGGIFGLFRRNKTVVTYRKKR